MDDDVLQLWESFPGWIKGATLIIILTYLTTLLAGFYGQGLVSSELSWFLAFWPFILIIWIAIVWFGFSLIVMVGVWVGGLFVKNPADSVSIVRKAKKIILYIPIVVGSIISVSVVFMSDIFRSGADKN